MRGAKKCLHGGHEDYDLARGAWSQSDDLDAERRDHKGGQDVGGMVFDR